MKQHCLPVKKPLRVFVLAADRRCSRRGDGVVPRNRKAPSGSRISFFSLLFLPPPPPPQYVL